MLETGGIHIKQKPRSTTAIPTTQPSKRGSLWNSIGSLKSHDIKSWERQYPIEIRRLQGELIRQAQGGFPSGVE